MNGVNVVLDVFSGAVHVADDVMYDIVDSYENNSRDDIYSLFGNKYSQEELNETMDELDELKNGDMLYTPDIYENVIDFIDAREPVVKALCLHIAHDCNLKCRYCFAEEGEYHGHRSLMSSEVGKAAIDFIIKSSGKRRNLEVDFFGGEPLMNFDVVKDIVEYAREKKKLMVDLKKH